MNKITISTAESCTGGNIAHLITSVAGSSAYYKGGVVSYCNEVKINVLGVKASDIEKYGVVSKQVAEAMAMGVRKLLDTDYAVATTGVAGPGASEGIPAGTVWVGICSRTEVKSKCLHLGTERIKNIDEASRLALDFLNNEFGLNLTYK
ncbi:MAG: CinA family protein [Paludibacteraceae bacterium]|nr:CinA family protein [Paludibacteraceae bacterium]